MRFLAPSITWVTLAALAIAGVHRSAATFTPMGDLEGGIFSSQPRGVSNDGKVVVGFSRGTDGNEAFRWTQSTGMVGLGDFPEGSYDSRARGVSADGSVVVGIGNKTSFINDAFRWTAEDGLVGLGDLPGGSVGSEASGVSADGDVVVGQSVMGTPILGTNIHAFRWTKASNSMTDLGTLNQNEGGASIANAVSGDGTAVVGYSSWTPGNQAIRWTQGTDMVGLGDLEGGAFASEAFAVSFDGSVVVGQSTSGNGTEAFRWTQATGMVGLGDLTGGSVFSSARGVSADGSIVVGSGNPSNSFRAMIWDADNGMRNLRDVLVNDYGLEAVLTGWTLVEASAISADGNYIVGLGTNPTGDTEGWLVKPRAASHHPAGRLQRRSAGRRSRLHRVARQPGHRLRSLWQRRRRGRQRRQPSIKQITFSGSRNFGSAGGGSVAVTSPRAQHPAALRADCIRPPRRPSTFLKKLRFCPHPVLPRRRQSGRNLPDVRGDSA